MEPVGFGGTPAPLLPGQSWKGRKEKKKKRKKGRGWGGGGAKKRKKIKKSKSHIHTRCKADCFTHSLVVASLEGAGPVLDVRAQSSRPDGREASPDSAP